MSASTAALIQALTPLRRRLQRRDSLKAAWITLGTGLGATALLLMVSRVWPLLYGGQILAIGLTFTLFLLILGQIYAWFRPLPLQKLARLGDTYLHLDERLITALELSDGRLSASPNIQQAQLNDTFTHLRRAPLSNAVPLTDRTHLLRISGVLLAVSITVAALYLAPNPQETVLQQQAKLADLLESEITELKEVQADLLANPDPLTVTEIEKISDTLAGLIERLKSARDNLSPEQAMAALSEAEQSLTQLGQERLAQKNALDSLAESLAQSDLSAAQEMAQALQNGDFEGAAEALQQMGENPSATQAEANALAQTLSQAALSVATTNPKLAQSLQQAADALQAGDSQAMQEALKQAAQQLAEAGAQPATKEQLGQALKNIQQARAQLIQQGQGTGAQKRRGAGGQGQGEGSGSGRGDPGAGKDGFYSVHGTEGIISTNNGPNQNRLEDYNSVYAPDHIGGQGGEFVIPDPQNPDGGGFDIGETAPGANHPAGEALVPYTEVYQQYRDQAGVALDSDYIPLGMKDYVRQYFGALEPE